MLIIFQSLYDILSFSRILRSKEGISSLIAVFDCLGIGIKYILSTYDGYIIPNIYLFHFLFYPN